MPEEDSGAGEMQQAQEVVDMTFPARDETTRVVEPREEPFDLPASARATERTAILRGPSTPPVCRDHLDAVLAHQTFVEGIAVVAAVADEARREVHEEAGVEGGGDELRLIR